MELLHEFFFRYFSYNACKSIPTPLLTLKPVAVGSTNKPVVTIPTTGDDEL